MAKLRSLYTYRVSSTEEYGPGAILPDLPEEEVERLIRLQVVAIVPEAAPAIVIMPSQESASAESAARTPVVSVADKKTATKTGRNSTGKKK